MAEAVNYLLTMGKLCGTGRSGKGLWAFRTDVGLRSPVLLQEWRAESFGSLLLISYSA